MINECNSFVHSFKNLANSHKPRIGLAAYHRMQRQVGRFVKESSKQSFGLDKLGKLMTSKTGTGQVIGKQDKQSSAKAQEKVCGNKVQPEL